MGWLEVIALGLLIGVPLGMGIMAFIVAATRCEGCCQRRQPPP